MLCLSGFELYSRWVPLLTAVRTRPVEFRENVRAFFPQGQSKLSVIMRCPGYSGVHKAAVCIPQLQSVRWLVLRWQQKQKIGNRSLYYSVEPFVLPSLEA